MARVRTKRAWTLARLIGTLRRRIPGFVDTRPVVKVLDGLEGLDDTERQQVALALVDWNGNASVDRLAGVFKSNPIALRQAVHRGRKLLAERGLGPDGSPSGAKT